MDLDNQMELYAARAVELAKENNYELDYSNTSIEQVEKILEEIYIDARKHNMSESSISNLANMFGAYVGVTFIKNLKQGKWKLDEKDGVLSVQIGSHEIYFPAKVYRRIKNGSEDNVVALYLRSYNQYSPTPLALKVFRK